MFRGMLKISEAWEKCKRSFKTREKWKIKINKNLSKSFDIIIRFFNDEFQMLWKCIISYNFSQHYITFRVWHNFQFKVYANKSQSHSVVKQVFATLSREINGNSLFNARDMIPYFISCDMTRYANTWVLKDKGGEKMALKESLKPTPMEDTHSRTRSEN